MHQPELIRKLLDGFAPAETRARVGVMSVKLVLVRLRDVQIYGIVTSTEGEPLKDVRAISLSRALSPARITSCLSGPEPIIWITRGRN